MFVPLSLSLSLRPGRLRARARARARPPACVCVCVCAAAAILDNPAHFPTLTVAVLSGGNIDPLLLAKVIQHGMAAAGRYLFLTIRIEDGGLAHLLADVGDAGASVIEVAHARIDADLPARRGRGAPPARDARCGPTPRC